MSLLAASVGFVGLLASGSQMQGAELAAWRRIEPAVVRLLNANQPVGIGVLIDSSGLFLAHRAASASPVLFGRMASGETLQLAPIAVDEVTQLVLLRAEGWRSVGRTPVTIGSTTASSQKGAATIRVVLVTTDGPLRGEMTQSSLIGVMAPSRRGLTLAELRFESSDRPSGGGLVFTMDGKLAGVVGATLDSQAGRETTRAAPGSAAIGAQADSAKALGSSAGFAEIRRSFGPGSMIVGYSITPDILDRVVDGFLSPSHRVEHPALGLMCQDAASGGALVVSLNPGGTAEKGGLRPGDIIFELANQKVANQMDYTRVLVRQTVGETITIKLRRGSEELTLDVRVGK